MLSVLVRLRRCRVFVVPPPPQFTWHPGPCPRSRGALAARAPLELVPLHATPRRAHGAAVHALVAVPGRWLFPSDVHCK